MLSKYTYTDYVLLVKMLQEKKLIFRKKIKDITKKRFDVSIYKSDSSHSLSSDYSSEFGSKHDKIEKK